jgi:alpha-glucosidase
MTWLASPAGVLVFRRGEGPDAITVMINLSAEPMDLLADDQVLLSSIPVTGGLLPPDTGVWLKGR